MTDPLGFPEITPMPAIHNAPPMPLPEFPFTPGQLIEVGFQLIEQFLKNVALALAKLIPGGGQAFEVLSDWADSVNNVVQDFFQSVVDIIQDIFGGIFGGLNFGDLPTPGEVWDNVFGSVVNIGSIPQNIVSGLQGALNELNDWITDIIVGIGNVLDDIPIVGRDLEAALLRLFNVRQKTNQNTDALYRGFSGDTASNVTPAAAEEAAAAAAATLAENSAAIAALQQQAEQENNGGVVEQVKFPDYANSAELPAVFTTTYTGDSRCGTWGVYGGTAAFVNAAFPDDGDISRTARAVYNVKPTDTDYQQIGAVFMSAPSEPGVWAFNYLRGRCNSSGTSAVEARFRRSEVSIVAVVGGVDTVLASTSHTFKVNNPYWFECGTAGGVRTFRVLSGQTPILTVTEVGTTSQVGSAYRYAGAGAFLRYQDTLFGATQIAVPGRMTYWLMADNTPATYLGSTARFFRSSETGAGQSANARLSNNFFDTIEYKTNDYTWTPGTNNRITVSVAGTYLVTLNLRQTSAADQRLTLWKNGTVVRTGANLENATYVQSSWSIYLQAGDYIEPGVIAGNTCAGDTAGVGSALEISRAKAA